jgi:toxin FitB
MNVVDSSGWLEYFAKGPNGEVFAPVIRNTTELLVAAVSLYEVFKRINSQFGEDAAFEAMGYMLQGKVIELDPTLAITAALLSTEHKLAMADSLILATAYTYAATLWTQDAGFAGIDGVTYIEKPKAESV